MIKPKCFSILPANLRRFVSSSLPPSSASTDELEMFLETKEKTNGCNLCEKKVGGQLAKKGNERTK